MIDAVFFFCCHIGQCPRPRPPSHCSPISKQPGLFRAPVCTDKVLFCFEAGVSHLSGQCDADAAALVARINVKASQLFLQERFKQRRFSPNGASVQLGFHENWNRNSAEGSASSSVLIHIFSLSVRLLKRFGPGAGRERPAGWCVIRFWLSQNDLVRADCRYGLTHGLNLTSSKIRS